MNKSIGHSTDVLGRNGLSSISGNGLIPLVGVFVNSDPFGSAAPPALTFDRLNPTNMSPLLNQVFYIGDGHAGADDPTGAELRFTAPSTATALYLGVVDADNFVGPSGTYLDDPGAFSATVAMSNASTVPEPTSSLLLAVGLILSCRLRPIAHLFGTRLKSGARQ